MSSYNHRLWRRNEPLLQTDFLVRERITGWLGPIVGKTILDAGCGEGYVVRKLAGLGAKVEAFDISPEMIAMAESREHHKIRYRIGDISNVLDIYPANSFDIVVLCGVIGSFNESDMYTNIGKIAGVIKNGGVLLVATNHMESYIKKAKSKWVEFTTEPEATKETQCVGLKFRNHECEDLFNGKYFFYSENQVKKALIKGGINPIRVEAPLATESDLNHFPHMWGDEKSVPYHLVVIGQKE